MSPRSDRFREAVSALDDHRAARAEEPVDLDSSLASVLAHEGDDWHIRALAALELAARTRPTLTVEHVDWPPSLDARARGAVLLEGARLGWLHRLGWVGSGPDRHGRPVRQWASLIHEGGPHAA